MYRQLSEDAWHAILRYLNQTQIINLSLTGDKRMLNIISALKIAIYQSYSHSASTSVLRWPPKVNHNSSLFELEFNVLNPALSPAEFQPIEIGTQLFPRTLTSLTLQCMYRGNKDTVPFIAEIKGAPAKLALMASSLPFLSTFIVNLAFNYLGATVLRARLFWILPPSVTYFSGFNPGNEIALHPKIPLPPNLIYCRSSFRTSSPFQFPPSLETLISNLSPEHIGDDLPHLRHLTLSRPSERLHSFPALVSLHPTTQLSSNYLADYQALPPRLTYLKCRHLPTWAYAYLPRSLTLISSLIHHDTSVPWRFDIEFLRDLPPALKELHLLKCHTYNPPGIHSIASLPRGLTTLDLGPISPKGALHALPPTITSLASRGINQRNVERLQLFPKLVRLKLIGGQITTKLALLLPRKLTHLSLDGVSLPTNGRVPYPAAFSTAAPSSSNSSSNPSSPLSHPNTIMVMNPDTSVLHGTLPPFLQTLNIKAAKRHTYWGTHAYDILIGLPVSLQNLLIYLGRERTPMNIHPYLPEQTKDASPSSSPPPSNPSTIVVTDHSTDLFERFVNLRVLHLVCRSLDAENGWFARRLPPNLLAYTGPQLSQLELESLPKTIRYLGEDTLRWSDRLTINNYLGHTPLGYRYEHFATTTFDPMSNPLATLWSALANLQ